jgi:hypothetical protein
MIRESVIEVLALRASVELGRLEDETRRERQRLASSEGGERALPRSMKAPRRPSRKS